MGAVRRSRRLWLAAGAIVVLVVITVCAHELNILPRILNRSLTQAEIQAKITSLAANPEPVPDRLWVRPTPGPVQTGDELGVSIAYALCNPGPVQYWIDRLLSDCDETINDMTVDGTSAPHTQSTVLSLGIINKTSVSDMTACLMSPLGQGQHVISVDAYPMGRYVTYSWVWTVGP